MKRLFTTLAACAVALASTVVTGSAAQAAGPRPAPGPHGSGPRPVVFVHGFTGSAANWAVASSVLLAAGYRSDQLFAYEYDSFGDNRVNAAGLRAFVEGVRAQTGAAKVDIVNHSMGGLVTQWYVHELGGTAHTAHVVSIAGANHGTTAAEACLQFVTCQQMIPGSSFLETISRGDETPGHTRYATWYSPCDGIILPYSSTRLRGAANHEVRCQTHVGFLTDTRVLGEIQRYLGHRSRPHAAG